MQCFICYFKDRLLLPLLLLYMVGYLLLIAVQCRRFFPWRRTFHFKRSISIRLFRFTHLRRSMKNAKKGIITRNIHLKKEQISRATLLYRISLPWQMPTAKDSKFQHRMIECLYSVHLETNLVAFLCRPRLYFVYNTPPSTRRWGFKLSFVHHIEIYVVQSR